MTMSRDARIWHEQYQADSEIRGIVDEAFDAAITILTDRIPGVRLNWGDLCEETVAQLYRYVKESGSRN